ncbi:MAG TPA: pseudouridine synthase [Methylocella sp.]|nr:pseudouridine synthase [Methylocella sp.]
MNGKSGTEPKDRRAASCSGTQRPDASARVAKVIARAGFCSRREAETLIEAGRVALNGVLLESPAVNVGKGDKIAIDGMPLQARARTRLFLFHKPRGLVTTLRDPQGRPTVFSYLETHWPQGPRVVSVGRLDINTEGLLLLTNDGGLARVLELPSTGWIRRYRVRANGTVSQADLDALCEGVTLDGTAYAGIKASLDRQQGANCWITMALREGKNREIKRLLEHLGLKVNRLIRLSYGPFQLGEMAEGAVDEVRTRVLRDQLGPLLAQAAGVDFSSPLDPEAAEVLLKPDLRSPVRKIQSRENSLRKPASLPAKRTDAIDGRGGPGKTSAKPMPRQRKHISVLRAEEQAADAPRKRIERREMADRAGRTVAVDELKRAGPHQKAQAKTGPRRPGKDATPRIRDGFGSRRSKIIYGDADVKPSRSSACPDRASKPRSHGKNRPRPRRG